MKTKYLGTTHLPSVVIVVCNWSTEMCSKLTEKSWQDNICTITIGNTSDSTPRGGGGGGGTLIFFFTRMLEPSICGATIKYQEFQAPQKIFEILATQKNPRGEYSNVFFIRRLGLSIYYSPPKTYQEFQAPQENI